MGPAGSWAWETREEGGPDHRGADEQRGSRNVDFLVLLYGFWNPVGTAVAMRRVRRESSGTEGL